MTAKVFSATNVGFDGKLIDVECDTSNGLPTLLIVGLGNKAIDEAKERVRSAIKNTGLEFPRKRITINLAPANLPKDGAHFDLPIALALLAVSGQIPQSALEDTLIVGELALDGTLRPVRSIIHYVEVAREHGLKNILLPAANAAQANLLSDVTILPALTLRDAYLHTSGQNIIQPYSEPLAERQAPRFETTLADVRGQAQAKRALTIAAAGGHNVLLSGSPGAGKTMLARSIVSILPPLSAFEIIEVTKLHSISSDSYQTVVSSRPFRSPHHSASHVALVGGGRIAKPGEISLAHRGVLFMDELPEYSRSALEALRQPLEDRCISIARANDRVVYPADFMFIATQNPCPCGYLGDDKHACSCTGNQIQLYQKKISGPLLDRIDMSVQVSRVEPNALLQETSLDISNVQRTVLQARERQYARYQSTQTNAHLPSRSIAKTARLSAEAQAILNKAAHTLHISARSYFKMIKVARTIADLDDSVDIKATHMSEALQYRPRLQITS